MLTLSNNGLVAHPFLVDEALIVRFRDECLNEHMFRNLSSARQLIEEWRTDYNAHRPHTSLGGLIPSEFATRSRTDQSENRVQL